MMELTGKQAEASKQGRRVESREHPRVKGRNLESIKAGPHLFSSIPEGKRHLGKDES